MNLKQSISYLRRLGYRVSPYNKHSDGKHYVSVRHFPIAGLSLTTTGLKQFAEQWERENQ